jgi:rare lipoprotein A
MRVFSALLIPMLLTVSAAAQDMQAIDEPAVETPDFTEIDGGMASYYGDELAGNRTASGERFDPRQMTGAHRSLPFGSMVRVTNVSNGDSVVVRINDRGPFSRGRVIDISHAAAREIGMHRSGTARVKLALLNDD